MKEILPDGAARDHMLRGLAGVRARLRGHALNNIPAAERAAGAILALMKNEDADSNL
jgi:hypothetical protein